MKTRLEIAILTLGLCSIAAMIGTNECHAQMAVKRSAGTLKRAVGPTRRAETLDSRVRGRDADMPTTQRSAAPVPAPTDDDASRSLDEPTSSDRDGSPAAASPGSTDRDASKRDEADRELDGREEDDRQNEGERTLGRACIYGRRDQVLYRPPGARCRGDQAEERSVEPQADRVAPRSARPR